MGSNGRYARGDANTEEGRQYKCINLLDDNIKVLVPKDSKKGIKLPEESHTPNRIYVSLHSKGTLEGKLKAVGVYGDNGIKMYEIHTSDHHDLNLHCHYWENGGPIMKNGKETDAIPLTDKMMELYQKIIKLL